MEQPTSKWWHPALSTVATKLSQGVLNEMKKRILSSNIQKEKLTLAEDSPAMRSFFDREIARYTKRKETLNHKNNEHEQLKVQIKELTSTTKNYEQIITQQFAMIKTLGEICKRHNLLPSQTINHNPEHLTVLSPSISPKTCH